MKAVNWVLIGILFLAAGIGVGFWLGHRASTAATADKKDDDAATTQPAEEEKPVASVLTAQIRQGRIQEKIVAFGPVTAQQSDVAVLSVPFESRIGRVFVTPGQQIGFGANVCEIMPSPATELDLKMAQAALAAAKKDLAQTQQRFNDKLATNQELLASQQAVDAAQLKADALSHGGASGPTTLKAPAAGIVSKVDVQEGQIVPAGGPLVEIAGGNRIVARLGVEPTDAQTIHPGDKVSLTQVNLESGEPVDGKVDLVTQRVSPDTRLVDVFVSLPKESGLLLEGFVRGEFTTASEGLIVPRSAVLPDDEGLVLFTVEDGKAVKHAVKIGLRNDQDAQVSGDRLKAGDTVVVVGNLELEDGMAVSAQAAPAPATQPADVDASKGEAKGESSKDESPSKSDKPSTTAPAGGEGAP